MTQIELENEIKELEWRASSCEEDRKALVNASQGWWVTKAREERLMQSAVKCAAALTEIRKELGDRRFQLNLLAKKSYTPTSFGSSLIKAANAIATVESRYLQTKPLELPTVDEMSVNLNAGRYIQTEPSVDIDLSDLDKPQEKYPKKRGKRFTRAQRKEIYDFYFNLPRVELRIRHNASYQAMLMLGEFDPKPCKE